VIYPTTLEHNKRMNEIEHSLNKGSVVLPYPPWRLRIEPTNICNFKCVSCPNAVEKPQHNGFMEMALFKKIVDQANNYPRPTILTLYLGGEPLLHKELIEMINYASKYNMFVELNTNASLLTKEMINQMLDTDLNRIAFSFDDMLPDEYEAFRKNSSYNTTLNNILDFLKAKQERKQFYPIVAIASLRVFKSGDEISQPKISDAFVSLFTEYNVVISSGYIHSWAGGFEINEGQLSKSAIGISDYDMVRKKKVPKCDQPWRDLVINYRGEVVTCCFDLHYKNILGDTKKNDIIDIWNNKKFQALRRTILRKQYDKIPLCSSCAVIKGDPMTDLQLTISRKN